MEWMHDSKPPRNIVEPIDVWVRGQVRTVWQPYGPYSFWMFSDCTHPLQNAICDECDIDAWRLRTKEVA